MDYKNFSIHTSYRHGSGLEHYAAITATAKRTQFLTTTSIDKLNLRLIRASQYLSQYDLDETFTGHLREWQLSLKSLYFKNQAVKVNNQALKEEVKRSQETTAKTTNETEELRRQFEESNGANGNLRIRLEGADTQL
ncbi:hypothetical protein H2201_008298 [Coniosporium apollinis]|uniref:Uncharacterized protein n=1 Tax=Coniosporium apollinis TaxID=61459 RepID=A0ABQ9NGH7_9PEZI|nr:hypothetical protein H2201_008298 [Coniosporium apollinis]